MGCKYCNKTEENNDIDFPTKASLKFNTQFDNFLTETESEKLTNDEFDKNIPENYLNYSNEHVFNLPPELKEKKDLHSVQPIKFKNGNIFKGKWNNESRMEGKGKYYLKDDNIFIEGLWENGELKYGRIFMPDGNIYKGEIKDSKYNGKGKLILTDAEYEGLFENGEFKNGKLKWNNGYEYEGDSYEGDFVNNLFHGNGIYKYSKSHDVYEGEFQYGMKKGKGKYIAQDKYIYDGNRDNDMPFGYGKLSNWDETCTLKCTFRDGKIAEEPIYITGSKEIINPDTFDFKQEGMKLNVKSLSHINIPENETTQFQLGIRSFLSDE